MSVKDMMNMEKATVITEERHAFMEAFLREWDAETGAAEQTDTGDR